MNKQLIRKRAISDLPTEKGWYLIQAPNNHPVNVGRAFFNGSTWQWSGTVKNYVAEGCTLEWLEELPEDFFTSSPKTNARDCIVNHDINCTCYQYPSSPTEIQEVETEKQMKLPFKYMPPTVDEMLHLTDIANLGIYQDKDGQIKVNCFSVSNIIHEFFSMRSTPLPDALQEVRGFQYFSEWLKTKTDIERAGDGYESLPEKSKHCIDFAVQRYVTFLTDKYPNPVQEVREKEEGVWIRFEDKKPEPGQPIWITWPSANYFPEYRELTETDLKQNWDMMFWLPVPPVPTPSAASNNNTEQNNQE
jgi:hypothetical protein